MDSHTKGFLFFITLMVIICIGGGAFLGWILEDPVGGALCGFYFAIFCLLVAFVAPYAKSFLMGNPNLIWGIVVLITSSVYVYTTFQELTPGQFVEYTISAAFGVLIIWAFGQAAYDMIKDSLDKDILSDDAKIRLERLANKDKMSPVERIEYWLLDREYNTILREYREISERYERMSRWYERSHSRKT